MRTVSGTISTSSVATSSVVRSDELSVTTKTPDMMPPFSMTGTRRRCPVARGQVWQVIRPCRPDYDSGAPFDGGGRNRTGPALRDTPANDRCGKDQFL